MSDLDEEIAEEKPWPPSELGLAREELLTSLRIWENAPVTAGDGYGIVTVRVWALAAILAALRPQDGPTGEEPNERARAAAQDLVDRLDFIHEHPSYKSVWTLAHIHGGYNGPNYAKELAALRTALRASPKPEPATHQEIT